MSTTGRTTSHYLSGNFAPVTEEVTETELSVTGDLPESLNGRFLRIGPNPHPAPDPTTYHWFSGTGMVHGVRLGDGRAEWYRNRFVRTDQLCQVKGWPPVPGDTHGGFDVVNTHVLDHGGSIYALVEGGARPVEISDELETLRRSDFGGTLDGGFTAHPKRNPATGEWHAVTYYWEWEFLRYLIVGTDGKVRHQVDVPVPDRPMVHDCAITQTSVLLFDLPVGFDLDMAMDGQFPYRWLPEHPARVGVLPLEGEASDVRWCEVDPCWVFHPLNAYDEADGRVVVDLVVHPSMFQTDLLRPNEGAPHLERWTIDPTAGQVKREVLDDQAQEFPRLDERLTGQRHRYGYGVTFALTATGPSPSEIIRHDLDRGLSEVWSPGPARSAMEPVFVPESPDAAEDDGWLLAYVHDDEHQRGDVVVLRADDLSAGPVATVHLPVRVPFGFHGSWVPDAP